ncbi:MAG TPA: phosphodiester glycosidase family protein [Sphingomicrobium sp.]|nr:phosphodiester glycosidase family protein [Sphingomicrobium sp.]
MRLALLPLFLLVGCDGSPQHRQGATLAESPCGTRMFEGSRFTVCPAKGGAIELFTANPSGMPYRSFAKLESELGDRAGAVAFAMNAGMFDEGGNAIGLLIERGKQLHRINKRGGGGNFGLLPNGVFLVRDTGKAEVVATRAFRPAADIAFATQSGPMLVIDGELHPAFEPDGESRNIRNGVGVAADGTALFAVSEDVVSFGKFARLFRDELQAENALYFDGSVSSLWDPANGRRDARAEIGPMVVVFKPAASAPGPEARAKP